MTTNTLIFVGSGIKFMSHLTTESKACIEKSEKVLHLVNEPAMQEWIKQVNPSSESLDFLYERNKERNDSYLSISNYILENLKKYKTLCVVMYGHPTVLVQSTLHAAKLAASNNYDVIFLPGISADACLYADLQIDPGSCGCQSFEATDFLLYRREYDASSHLILWQASVIGVLNQPEHHDPRKGLAVLAEYLSEKYAPDHEIISYIAAQYPKFKPQIEKILLKNLGNTFIDRISMLYIPPCKKNEANIDMLNKIKEILGP
jgi:uncharacterized protein YabN with tetrapyrrole methylase and pyrophosphatase domain